MTHSPERKSENAMIATLGGVSGVQTRSRFSGKVKTLPNIEVICESCDGRDYDETNHVLVWACQMRIRIRSRYEKEDQSEGAVHDELVATISDKIADMEFVADLNAHSETFDFVATYWRPTRREFKAQDGELVTELSGDLWIVPTAGTN